MVSPAVIGQAAVRAAQLRESCSVLSALCLCCPVWDQSAAGELQRKKQEQVNEEHFISRNEAVTESSSGSWRESNPRLHARVQAFARQARGSGGMWVFARRRTSIKTGTLSSQPRLRWWTDYVPLQATGRSCIKQIRTRGASFWNEHPQERYTRRASRFRLRSGRLFSFPPRLPFSSPPLWPKKLHFVKQISRLVTRWNSLPGLS